MRSSTFVSVLLLCACGVPSELPEEEDVLETGEAPLAVDSADRACAVVLRSAVRAPGTTGGFLTKCNSNGVCYFVWDLVLDVATTAPAGSKPYVLYRSTDQTTWSKKAATATTGAPTGFKRFKVRLETNTVNAGMSPTSLQRAKLELSPYLQLANGGGRVFDHNRNPGDFDVYALVANNSWSVSEDAAVCRPPGQGRAVVEFKAGWSTVQHGALIAGGKAVIQYDPARLQNCRGTHNGYPAWDLTATVLFRPSNTKVEGSVRTFGTINGIPDQAQLRPLPLEAAIPAGTTSAEVWFVNTGLWCSPTYDSNDSRNYVFPVASAPPATIAWLGNARASTSRDCAANQAAPAVLTLDSYIRERACSFVEADVYAPGLTDQPAQHPELLLARAELTLDGVALDPVWLGFQQRVGNDYRFRFELPRDTLYYGAKWSTLDYTLAFSTDGVVWTRDSRRSVKRDPSWCNPAWGSCQ